jgi:Regulator of chromosome condensation (RCC1) repeat/Putative Ig domain/PASTA domain
MMAAGHGAATSVRARSVAALLLALLATMGCWADTALASESGQVAAGGTHSCAIKADDTLVCWGSQGGVPADLGSVEQVAAGGKHDCAIKSDGTPVCWGDDSKGQSMLPADIGTVTQISAGEEHTCAVKTDGTPVCWGDDAWGQSTLPAGIGTVTQISAGAYNTCAVKTDGTPICWGDDSDGQSTLPADIGTVTQIATAGEGHTCAIKTDGAPICWGDNDFGEATIPAGIGTVTQITVGEWHTCAIKTDGTPICWGRNAPIGPQPSLPSDIGTVTQISAGLYHTCAIKTDKTVTCWGSHIAGQLGGSPTIGSSAPPPLVGVGQFSHTYTAEPAMGGFGAGELVIRFFLSSGSFPPGLTLDEATGLLSGTPTEDGTYTGVVSATNDVFSPETQAFSITVDTTAPPAPSRLGAVPPSPSPDLHPGIFGTAEAGSTVRLYDNAACAGSPRATGSATAFSSAAMKLAVTPGSTTIVYATATDAAGNVSACSTSSVTYVNAVDPIGDPAKLIEIVDPGRRGCIVPRLPGKTLARAKTALKAANCKLGKVTKPRRPNGRRGRVLVVKSTSPRPGAQPADGKVDLTLRVKPRRIGH